MGVLTHFEFAGQECFFTEHLSTSKRKEHKNEVMKKIRLTPLKERLDFT